MLTRSRAPTIRPGQIDLRTKKSPKPIHKPALLGIGKYIGLAALDDGLAGVLPEFSGYQGGMPAQEDLACFGVGEEE